MKMLLFVSAVALLAGSALMYPAGTHHNLNRVIDLIDSPNKTLNELKLVEEVARSGCKDEFFCKVHHILQNNTDFRANVVGEQIVRNLEVYLSGAKVDCPVMPENRTVDAEIEMGAFLATLKTCIQNANFMRGTVPMKTVG